MTSPLRLLAFALLLAPSLLPAAENQRFILERPYPVAELPEPDRSLPVTNVILMIGDGMGIHHLSAAWAANRGRLFIENCPVTGISKTWCADKLVTDSAAAGTAMATGTKTLYHRVAVCPKGNRLDSLVDKAADMGKSTGVIATCELNDATPASFCANNEKRSDAYGIIGDYPRSRADFIFGGGDALFENCVIRTVDNHIPHSYVTAPSGKANGLGFVFWNCDFVSDCPAGSVYLGRPWRPEGKTAVLDCRLGAHIAPEGFIAWNDRTDTGLASFAEADSTGPGAAERPAWVKQLSGPEAAELLAHARTLCRPKSN